MPDKNWTYKEIIRAFELKSEGKTYPEIASVLHRSIASVSMKMFNLNRIGISSKNIPLTIRTDSSWTKEQEDVLKTMHPNFTNSEIAEKVGHTKLAVGLKALRMGLMKPHIALESQIIGRQTLKNLGITIVEEPSDLTSSYDFLIELNNIKTAINFKYAGNTFRIDSANLVALSEYEHSGYLLKFGHKIFFLPIIEITAKEERNVVEEKKEFV